MNNNYKWQGEPVSVRFGYVTQFENTDKPLFWYNFECHNDKNLDGSYSQNREEYKERFALIPAIEITQDDQVFVIANHYGIGVSKLLKGGSPNHVHFSLLKSKFEEDNSPVFRITSFDLEGYEHHESNRREWQKANFPEEFERLERLRTSFRNVSLTKI